MIKMQRNFNYTFTDVELATDPSNELTHFGRRGMRWYQHIFGRAQVGGYAKGSNTKGVSKGKAKTSGDNKETTDPKKQRKPRQVQEYDKMKKTKTSELTDQEINRLMARMDLEQRLNAKRYEASKTKFDRFMDKYGDTLVREGTNFLKSQGDKLVDNMIKKAMKDANASSSETKKITQDMADQVRREADFYQNSNRKDTEKAKYDAARAEAKQNVQKTVEQAKETVKEQKKNIQANKVEAAKKEAAKKEDDKKDQYGYIRKRRYKK